MKALLAILLVALVLPPSARTQTNSQPHWIVPAVCGIIVIGAGIYLCVKVCKWSTTPPRKLPGDDDEPPPNVPLPQTNSTPRLSSVQIDASNIPAYDVSDRGWRDPVTLSPITDLTKFTVEYSPDLKSWVTAGTVRVWYALTSVTVMCSDTNNVPVAIASRGMNEATYLPVNLNGPGFYRVKGL